MPGCGHSWLQDPAPAPPPHKNLRFPRSGQCNAAASQPEDLGTAPRARAKRMHLSRSSHSVSAFRKRRKGHRTRIRPKRASPSQPCNTKKEQPHRARAGPYRVSDNMLLATACIFSGKQSYEAPSYRSNGFADARSKPPEMSAIAEKKEVLRLRLLGWKIKRTTRMMSSPETKPSPLSALSAAFASAAVAGATSNGHTDDPKRCLHPVHNAPWPC